MENKFNFYELLIKVTNFQTESQIQEINTKFANLSGTIKNSKDKIKIFV